MRAQPEQAASFWLASRCAHTALVLNAVANRFLRTNLQAVFWKLDATFPYKIPVLSFSAGMQHTGFKPLQTVALADCTSATGHALASGIKAAYVFCMRIAA